MFDKIINDTIFYLNNLRNLPENWIGPGYSINPNNQSIEDSIYLVKRFQEWYNNSTLKQIPNIKKSPIPIGGIFIEILNSETEDSLGLYLYNNYTNEVDFLINDNFEDELELNFNEIEKYFNQIFIIKNG